MIVLVLRLLRLRLIGSPLEYLWPWPVRDPDHSNESLVNVHRSFVMKMMRLLFAKRWTSAHEKQFDCHLGLSHYKFWKYVS